MTNDCQMEPVSKFLHAGMIINVDGAPLEIIRLANSDDLVDGNRLINSKGDLFWCRRFKNSQPVLLCFDQRISPADLSRLLSVKE